MLNYFSQPYEMRHLYMQSPSSFLYWFFYSNVRPILDAHCSGRQSCSVVMHEFWGLTERWDLTNSCPKELNNFLQAQYICVPGELFVIQASNPNFYLIPICGEVVNISSRVVVICIIPLSCILVVMPRPYCCQLPGDSVRVQVSSGILASSVSVSSGCGGFMCPWELKVVAGQQINITLIDFQYGKFNCSDCRFCYAGV